jgi:CTP synthase
MFVHSLYLRNKSSKKHMVILIYVSAGLVAASSGQLDRVLQDCCNGHVVPAKPILSNGSYNPTVHQNGHPKKLANGLSNGTYYANGNGVHA